MVQESLGQPEVIVLLSSYNGEKYIEQQIESILNQEGVWVTLVVRDDGSTDGTSKILEDYEKSGRLHFVRGTNLGFIDSFWELVMNAPEAPYYAFADQDDVWLKNKLQRAVECLSKEVGTPMLYCANYYTVDEYLEKKTQSTLFSMDGWKQEYFILTQTPALGNTMVWNNSLQQELKLHPECDWCCEHDHRLQFAAAMLGKVVIDKERTILYRQHTNNISGGVGGKTLNWIKVRLKLLMRRMFGNEMQRHSGEIRAKSFLFYYGSELNKGLIKNLRLVSNYRNSIKETMQLLKSDMCAAMPLKIKIRIILHCL